MKNIRKKCDRIAYCMERCEKYLNSCEWCGVQSLRRQDVRAALIVGGRVVTVDMKTLMQLIETIAWFDIPGTLRPIRFRHQGNVVTVEQIIRISEEKLAGNRMKIYECQSEIHGQIKRFELKFEMNTCKWFLYKI